ncbi:multicopper oxidase [Glomus cerebriforme]|uniref:Multicopper oxidase n=1 Tax=Glomus cerebriforme TaxID=658196 RepID=A0A397SNG7_9GLOM|nr:multicopper oxidase [Glomus cerebriforme]
MKLSFFILLFCCILQLVLAEDIPKCKCVNPAKNCDKLPPCACDQLPQCGKAIFRTKNSCDVKPNNETIANCNKIHFSKNLNNELGCPDGTKAWPLMFIWEIEYLPVDLDGFPRNAYRINNGTPPTIHAIKGDWVLIPVINNIDKQVEGKEGEFEPTTIHWHGVTMRGVERETERNETEQPGTPFMDGVPGINQCAIPGHENQGKNIFYYFFQFVDSGTYWYHSHFETQLADGLAGIMVVKDCEDINRVKNLNDYGLSYNETDDWDENLVSVQDWFHKDGDLENTVEENFIKYINASDLVTVENPFDNTRFYIPNEPVPNSGLISGKNGVFKTNNGDKLKRFHFVAGKTYRLRLINMSAMTMYNFAIDNHTFEIIEVEGMLVERNKAFSTANFTELPINTGQRYSILVNANQKSGVYWMRFNSIGCYRDPGTNPPELRAIVDYDNSDAVPPDSVHQNQTEYCKDLPINALIPYCGKNHNDPTYTLFCKPPPCRNGAIYNMTIILDTTYGFIGKIDDNDPWEQNVAGFLSPEIRSTYLDHKWTHVKNNTFLEVLKLSNDPKPKSWDKSFNAYNLNEAKVVDVFFNNIDPLEHPIHLHGHFFYVLGVGNNIKFYSLNEVNPIQRDTLTVPSRGWAQIRFVVNNPGVWPMHCHIDWHLGVGMLAQFVELGRSDAAKIFTKGENKPPKEWCEACPKHAEGYCAV